jgi:hypothetical protein
MAAKHILAIAFCGLAVFGPASAEPEPKRCTVSFEGADGQGGFASANIKDGTLLTLTVELGPIRTPLAMAGEGIARGYSATAPEPELAYWTYMSIYEPAAEWLTPGSVQLYYSGFRLGWPVFRRGENPVNNLELTVTQGDQSMVIDVRPDETGTVISSRAIAIDFEDMLPGRAPAVRVPSHLDWRRVSEQGNAVSATLMNIETREIVARGTATEFDAEIYQTLLSGGMNALRDKFKAGQCE